MTMITEDPSQTRPDPSGADPSQQRVGAARRPLVIILGVLIAVAIVAFALGSSERNVATQQAALDQTSAQQKVVADANAANAAAASAHRSATTAAGAAAQATARAAPVAGQAGQPDQPANPAPPPATVSAPAAASVSPPASGP